MCGIAGLFNFSQSLPAVALAERVVRQMIESIAYRGPDAEAVWADPQGRCVLGHRRLSIIDTSDAGRQPMAWHDGRWIITFNGEIYNFQELRRQLEATGVEFYGRTDTEVLLAGIAKWGVEVLPRLDGMFAFAAFNRESGEILLARDPFGEKPLYHVDLPGGGLAFASELHCLEALPGFDSELSLDAMAEVLMFQYIGAPRTIYRSVKKLEPGHWLTLSPGSPPQIQRYFEFAPGRADFDRRSIGDLADELEDLLVTSLRRRLISDVPLGAFLSGGVDSSTVCALIRKRLDVPLKTFSIGFEGAEESEHEIARQFARHLGTEHHDRILRPDTARFLEDIGSVLDEPNADSSCMPTYLLSQFARRQVTVAISGDGGDEMFGGYGRYFDTLLDQPAHGKAGASSWLPGAAYYSGRILVFEPSPIEALFGQVPEGLARHLSALKQEINQSRDRLLCALRKTDVENYMPGAVLPKVDRMSMRHSLEVRTPFLSVALARFAERLPPEVLVRGRHGKLVLRELAYRYLPKHLIDMPKQGFGIPMSEWGKKELLVLAERKLKSDDSRLLDMLGSNRIEGFLSRQDVSGGFSAYQVWGVVMLESWLQSHSVRLPQVSKADGTRDVVRAGMPRSTLFAGWIAPRVLAVLPGDMALNLTGPCNSAEERERRDRVASTVVDYCRGMGPEYFEQSFADGKTQFEARQLPVEEDLGNALRRAGFSLRGVTVVVVDLQGTESPAPNTLSSLQRAGAKGLIYPHPHRSSGHLVRVSFSGKRALRRLIDITRLKARAIASWSLAEVRHIEGFSNVIGPFSKLPAVINQELSHQVMVFEGRNQLPPIFSTHESISAQGGGRYSVWNQHVFFSPVQNQKLPELVKAERYWAVENNARNAALLPMTVRMLGEGLPRTGQTSGMVMLESWPRAHPVNLPKSSEADGEPDAARIGSSRARFSAGWIAPEVLAVLPRDMVLNLTGPCNSVEEREHRDRFATIIIELCCRIGPEYFEQSLSEGKTQFEARELPAEMDLADALRSAGFSLRGATVVVVDLQGAESLGPKTLSGLQRAGAKGLIYPHPHRSSGHLVRVNFSGREGLRRLIDIARLKARALASWSLADARHIKGFSNVIGPFSKLPAVINQELSHQVMVFEGRNQLAPIYSTHQSISTQGEGRYSVWNQHVFFSPMKIRDLIQAGKGERYWAVENNAKNSALLPMTISISERISLPECEFVSRLGKYLDVISRRCAQPAPACGDPKCLVVLTHALPPGGAERQWCYLAIGLERLGYDVRFVTYDWLEGELAHYQQLLASNGIQVIELGRVGIPSLMRTLARDPDAHSLFAPEGTPLWIRLAQLVTLLSEIRPAAIFAQLDAVNILAGIAGTITGTPKIIFSFRNVNPSNFSYLKNDWFLPAYRALIRNPAITLSGNSRTGCEDYARWIGISTDRVKYVGNAVGDEMIGQPGNSALSKNGGAQGVSSTSLSILGVFRLSEEKRPLLFLDVCEKVRSVVPDAQVGIAGIGPMAAQLAAEIQKRGIGHYVKLLGRRHDVYELMRSSSLLLLTSSFEGTPNVVMEAQTLGVPVVATNVGGVADVVVDGETGFLADVDDEASLVKGCTRILTDETIRTRMGDAARCRIAKSFTVESMVKHYLELLQGDEREKLVAETQSA